MLNNMKSEDDVNLIGFKSTRLKNPKDVKKKSLQEMHTTDKPGGGSFKN